MKFGARHIVPRLFLIYAQFRVLSAKGLKYPGAVATLIKMAKLCDFVNVKYSNVDVGGAFLLRLAFALNVSVSDAAKAYAAHGNGRVYARGASLVLEDTPHARANVIAHFGRAVIVDERGNIFQDTAKAARAKRRKRAKIAAIVEARQIARAEKAYDEKKRHERNFAYMQGAPSPKRAGKADSHGDIGKYVNFRNARLFDVERRELKNFYSKPY